MSEAIQIGVYKLEEEKSFRNSFEVAAWYTEINVPAGDYPVFAKITHKDLTPKMTPGKIEDTSVSCKVEGKVIGSNFSSLFCGNVITPKIDEDVGKTDCHYINPYAHSIAHAILEGQNTNFQLSPEYHARYTYFLSNGEISKSAGIFQISTDAVWIAQQKCEENNIVLSAFMKENEIIFISYKDNSLHINRFDKDNNKIVVIESSTVTDENKKDIFFNVREKYLMAI